MSRVPFVVDCQFILALFHGIQAMQVALGFVTTIIFSTDNHISGRSTLTLVVARFLQRNSC